MVASVGPTNAAMSAQRETDHFKAQLAEATKAVASTEKKLAVLEASVAALLHGDGTSAAVPGRCGQATDVDAIASAATALSLDDTVGNHTDDFAERRCGSAL